MKSRLIVLLLCVLFLLHFLSIEEFWKLYQAPVNDKEGGRRKGETKRKREREVERERAIESTPDFVKGIVDTWKMTLRESTDGAPIQMRIFYLLRAKTCVSCTVMPSSLRPHGL